ncbi:MAG TPA: glycosyltransferase family 2 protein [Acetobacteraceae bacterium]|nr:glycosyltransferase family 2 protein [Acetobacteraceae bacterium]
MPRVSVLMTTYNGAAFIARSIDSVLSQTWHDFEFVVVDDASTDRTPEILGACHDPRLRIIRHEQNQGIVASRNAGFAVASGEFVAALDHDDLYHPERLQRQVAWLDDNPRVVLLGTEVILDSAGRQYTPDHPAAGDPLALRWLLLTDNPLTWSSVMFRAGAARRLGTFLRPEFELADDFDFYHRLLAIGEIARLDDVLTTYRFHAASASSHNASRLDDKAARVLATAYTPFLGADAPGSAALAVQHWLNKQPPRDAVTLDLLADILQRLLAGFCAPGKPGSAAPGRIAALAGDIWWRTVRSAARAGSPWLLGRRYAYPALKSWVRPSQRDIVASAAAGLLRAYRGRR